MVQEHIRIDSYIQLYKLFNAKIGEANGEFFAQWLDIEMQL